MAIQNPKVRGWLLTAALVGGTAIGAAGIASAASTAKAGGDSKPPASAPAQGQQQSPRDHDQRPPAGQDPAKVDHGPGETLLTGSDAQRATDAALAAVPGASVIRVETDSAAGGSYEVHLAKSDGTPVTVKLDGSFKVTGTEAGFGPCPKGPHGGPPPAGSAPSQPSA